MPIYEFKCQQCQHCFEFLLLKSDDEVTMQCPSCKGQDIERVLSTTSYVMGGGSGSGKGPSATNRSCSGGSCTTIDLPGPD